MVDPIATLEAQLVSASTLPEKIDIMNALAWEVRLQDLQRAFTLAHEAHQLAQQHLLPLEIANSLASVCYFNALQGNYTSVFEIAERVMGMGAETDYPEAYIKCLIAMGGTYRQMGSFPQALDAIMTALNLSQRTGNLTAEVNTAAMLGGIYRDLNNPAEAIPYFERGLTIRRELGHQVNIMLALHDVAKTYLQADQPHKALEYVQEGLTLSAHNDQHLPRALLMTTMSKIQQKLANHAAALSFAHQAIQLYQTIDFQSGFLESLTHIGELYLHDQPAAALPYLHQALEIAQEIDAKPRLYVSHQLLAESYKKLGDFQTAMYHFEQFFLIKEAVFDAEVSQMKNIRLQQEIAERQRIEEALHQAKEEAEAANRAKSAFLANMSHELRTPLNAIIGFTQLLRRSKNLNADQQEELFIIDRSSQHLLELINDVLDLSKIEAGHVSLNETSFTLSALVDDMEQLFRIRAKSKSLYLRIEPHPALPAQITADERKLRQILINLLSNAIKFTEIGGVTLRVEPRYEALYFAVEDTGMGIASHEIESLFRAFSQTESGRKIQQGTGLGLALTHQFVELMGGEIQVKSELEQGSIFSFTIPVKTPLTFSLPEKRPHRQVVRLSDEQHPYRILVVDDTLENRLLLQKLLIPLGFEVEEAANGEEAVAWHERWEPHLIFMDMRMPVMDGYEASRRIKASTQGQATAIIALTASTFEEERSVVLSAGCDGFLRKPFLTAELFDKITEHLGVQFIYETIEDHPADHVSPPPALTADDLRLLPLAWVSEMHQLALMADARGLLLRTQEIQAQHPHLALGLQWLIKTYDLQTILSLTEFSEAIHEP